MKLSKKELQLTGRQHQHYDLDDEPYGRKPRRGQPELHGLTFLQVKARPGDPRSPFLWGNYALMMVCGGHFRAADRIQAWKEAKGRKPGRTVWTDGYSGERDWIEEPKPDHSTAGTTGTLISRMLLSRFTWTEALDCLERHPLAGGAWLAYMKPRQGTAAMLEDWKKTRSILNPSTGEIISSFDEVTSIDPSWSPWKGLDHYQPLVVHPGYTTTGDKGIPISHPDRAIPIVQLHGVRYTEIRKKHVARLLELVGDPPATYIVGDDDHTPVSTIPQLKQDKLFKFPYADEALRKGYIPWLLEHGLLLEHDSPKRNGGGKGRTPATGYTLPPFLDSIVNSLDLWSMWGAGVAEDTPKPAVAETPVPCLEKSKPLTTEALTWEHILAAVS